MNDAFLEIFTEHLPARFLIPALNQMQLTTQDILNRHNLKFENVRAYGTFRRLVVHVKNLAAKAEDVQKEIKGPPAKLLKDADGNYTPQASGFAEKNGISPDKLITVETDKGPFIYAKVKIKGEAAAKLLPGIFKEIITSLTFPKNMVWEDSGLKFARPIRGLVALYGPKIINFEIAGVKSGRDTYPISSFGRKPVKIASPEVYAKTLRNQPQPILVELEDRREALIRAVNACAKNLGYKADLDEDLITETISFTEHPVALAGDMSLEFIRLPKELVSTVLKKQLRMFPVLDNKGNLQPHFIAVRDGISVNTNEVREGFKNVMTARLTDAVFFYKNDIKTGLDKMQAKLATVNFIDGMGNMRDKTRRVEELAPMLAFHIKSDLKEDDIATLNKAAPYCYADLTSGVVYEFPELQGYMGSVYAAKEDFPPAAAKALGEFYLPLTASSALPRTTAGAILSLAGKMDTLAANFAMGQIPTGSEDPFALRRCAMGAVRIMLGFNCAMPLQKVIDTAAARLPKTENPQIDKLYGFMWQRVANILEQEGISHDEIAAVENLKEISLPQIMIIAKALHNSREGSALTAVGEAAKRVGNILKKADFKDGAVRPGLFTNDAEKDLYNVSLNIGKEVAAILNRGKIDENTCAAVFEQFALFKTPLENFFEKVMVNDGDSALRANRLALLGQINTILTLGIADLSKLQKRG